MQRIVDRLLCGVVPSAFGTNVRIVCAEDVKAPCGFENHWSILKPEKELDELPDMQDECLAQVSVMVIVASLLDAEHRKRILDLGSFLRGHPMVSPPVFLVPVMDSKALQGHETGEQHVKPLLASASVDDVIWGTLAGYSLAFAVQAKLLNLNVQLSQLQDNLQERVSMLEQRNKISNEIDFTQWQYLRTRMFHAIPPVRNDLEDAHQQSVGGLQVGRRISLGAFGAQHMVCR